MIEKWFFTVPIKLEDESHWQTRQLFSDWEGQDLSILETYDGLQIRVHSIIEAVKYLLGIGVLLLLTEVLISMSCRNILTSIEVLHAEMVI